MDHRRVEPYTEEVDYHLMHTAMSTSEIDRLESYAFEKGCQLVDKVLDRTEMGTVNRGALYRFGAASMRNLLLDRVDENIRRYMVVNNLTIEEIKGMDLLELEYDLSEHEIQSAIEKALKEIDPKHLKE